MYLYIRLCVSETSQVSHVLRFTTSEAINIVSYKCVYCDLFQADFPEIVPTCLQGDINLFKLKTLTRGESNGFS